MRCGFKGRVESVSEQQPQVIRSEYRGVFGKTTRVIADLAENTVRFENCHTPRKFLATCEREFVCPMDDIREVHEFTSKGHATLTIVTTHGKAHIPGNASNYQQLQGLLSGISNLTPSGPAVDHPMMGLVYIVGATVGLFTGVACWATMAPSSSSAGLLMVLMFVGAAIGVAFIALIVSASDRFLGIRLVVPIGLGCMGGTIGMALAKAAPSGKVWIVLVAFGVIAGATIGVFGEKRKGHQAKEADHER